MSRSYPYSSNHSRSSRQPQTPNLAVTEASFQSLHLSDTGLPSSYSTSNQYPSRGSYGQDSLSTNYLAPGYEAATYASGSPSGSYLGSQRGVSPFPPLEQDPSSLFDIDPSSYSKSDMGSYSYNRAPVPSSYDSQGSYASSRSPSMHDYAYAGGDAPSRRSMSYPSGPHILPSSVLDAFSTEDREVARQRRRRLSESRRLAKARVRRTRLPTISEPMVGVEENMGPSIDYFAAPSTSSSYDLGGSSGYARTSSTSSAPYLSGVSSSSNPYGPSYTSNYGVGDVGSRSLYPNPSAHLPSNISPSSTYGRSRQPSIAPSISPNPDETIRILENPRKPQCFDHGCNGRQFSTFSNLLRHQREKSGTASKSYCPRCGAEFTRTTARNGHMAHDKCKPQPQK
ncbi:MAG: hypothetical protein Q9213_007131 [Squamulea squamosa]